MKKKVFIKSALSLVLIIILSSVTVFAAIERGKLGNYGTYEFECTSGNIFSEYVLGSSVAEYNGETEGGDNYTFAFTDGRTRVEVTLDDGTVDEDFDDFEGNDYDGDASIKVSGMNDGSAYCYARVSGVYLWDDDTYSETNKIEVSTLVQ